MPQVTSLELIYKSTAATPPGKYMATNYPKIVDCWLNNKEESSSSKKTIEKINPATGQVLGKITSGNKIDANKAVTLAQKNFSLWKNIPIIQRADILRRVAILMQERRDEIAKIVHLETGKSVKDALAETEGAIELGFFYAGEGRRYYGKVTSSAMPNRTAMIIRKPVGICVLIVPFNTPIANVAAKSFPALLCGNTVILKASKDTPYTPVWFAQILKKAGLPAGVFSVLQGSGAEVGQALISDERVNLISFTGSTKTGQLIAQKATSRFVKLSLEMGGKNPFVVCDDADLDKAAEFAVSSAFSNAGQRCASASRLIVFEKVSEQFKKLLLGKTEKLKVGNSNTDDLGPVINEKQLKNILSQIKSAQQDGIKVLLGGVRLSDQVHKKGFYVSPTILENVKTDTSIYNCELFGPVVSLIKVKNFQEALKLANYSSYGLTSAIHTKNINRIQEFINNIEVGVVSVNGPSYGSEPHMPFGGVKQSGNGTREPGIEALDIYSNIKTVYIKHDPHNV